MSTWMIFRTMNSQIRALDIQEPGVPFLTAYSKF